MARDHRYHKRHNFTTAQMEDYEVRDVMSRRTHPKIKASIFINKLADSVEQEGLILVNLENHGTVLARDVMVELEVPFNLNGLIWLEAPIIVEHDEDGDYYLVRLSPGFPSPPLFPKSNKTLRRKFKTNIGKIEHVDNRPVKSRPYLNITIYADEMPPILARLDVAPVLAGWTPIPARAVK
jgi:hypothetical protein